MLSRSQMPQDAIPQPAGPGMLLSARRHFGSRRKSRFARSARGSQRTQGSCADDYSPIKLLIRLVGAVTRTLDPLIKSQLLHFEIKDAMPGTLASMTCFLRVAALVSAIRSISMIPPNVAKDLVGTTVTAQGMSA